jgi:NitT/TauT family transport system permease protein
MDTMRAATGRDGAAGAARGAAPAEPAPSRGRSLVRALWAPVNLLRLAFLIVVLAIWQALSTWLVGEEWISSPSLVAGRLGSLFADGSLVRNSLVTLQEAALGLVIGVAIGLVAGILVARAPRPVARALDPFVLGVYSMPRVALAPFFILWFGIGLYSKVALVVSVVAFVVLFNVRQGIEAVDRDMIDALRSMRASRWQMTRYVLVPAVLTWLIAAIKIAVGMAVVSAVVGEIIGSTEGLGWYMTQAVNQFDMTGAVASLLTMAFLAMLLYGLVGAIERRVCHWQVDTTATTVST